MANCRLPRPRLRRLRQSILAQTQATIGRVPRLSIQKRHMMITSRAFRPVHLRVSREPELPRYRYRTRRKIGDASTESGWESLSANPLLLDCPVGGMNSTEESQKAPSTRRLVGLVSPIHRLSMEPSKQTGRLIFFRRA